MGPRVRIGTAKHIAMTRRIAVRVRIIKLRRITAPHMSIFQSGQSANATA